MLIEILLILWLTAVGGLLLKSFGLKGWSLAPLGFISGIALYDLIFALFALGQYRLGIFIPNLLILIAISLIPVATAIRNPALKKVSSYNVKFISLSVVVISLLVAMFYSADLVRFHSDSLKFLFGAEHLYEGSLKYVDAYFIDTRLSTVSIIHTLGHFAGNDYLRSLTPLLSISLLASFSWIIIEGSKVFHRNISRTHLSVFIGAGLLLMLSSHAYLFHSFYLNGHLMIAAYFLVTAGAGWLLSVNSRINKNALIALMILGIIGLVFTRVEGFLYAIAAAAPVIGSPAIGIGLRKVLAIGLGATMILQHIVKIGLLGIRSQSALMHGLPVLALGLAIIAFALFILDKKLIKRIGMKLVSLLELGFWAALLVLFIRDQSILIDSLYAIYQNAAVKYSPWGFSFISLLILFAVVALVRKFKDQVFIRLPITLFVPTVFVIAYLRDGAYRVAHADSLNRMLIQVVPLIILFVILGIAYGKDRFRKLSTNSK